MDAQTRDRLLQLNRHFYATVAAPFHETRKAWSPGKARLLDWMPAPADRPLRVLDVGCGNGRFAHMLENLHRPVDYTGVDGDAALLDLARAHTADLVLTTCRFYQADLAEADWDAALDPSRAYDVVLCLATLQHLPGEELRGRVVSGLADLVAPGGLVIASGWQFLTAPRLVDKLVDWQSVGLDPAYVDPGDALLPWRQEVYAVRYVHQIDSAEFDRLAAAAGLAVTAHFRADGKEGNLNYYAIMQAREDGPS